MQKSTLYGLTAFLGIVSSLARGAMTVRISYCPLNTLPNHSNSRLPVLSTKHLSATSTSSVSSNGESGLLSSADNALSVSPLKPDRTTFASTARNATRFKAAYSTTLVMSDTDTSSASDRESRSSKGNLLSLSSAASNSSSIQPISTSRYDPPNTLSSSSGTSSVLPNYSKTPKGSPTMMSGSASPGLPVVLSRLSVATNSSFLPLIIWNTTSKLASSIVSPSLVNTTPSMRTRLSHKLSITGVTTRGPVSTAFPSANLPRPFSISTTTMTTTDNGLVLTSTSTRTGKNGIVTVVASSPARGMAYNAYINPFNIDNDPTWRDDFESMGPSYFNSNSNTIVTCGIAQDITFFNDDIYTSMNGYLPGETTLTDLEHIAVVYHGYFVPPMIGTYVFTAGSDDWGYVWLGNSTAKTAWNESNWATSNRAGGPSTSGPLTIDRLDEIIPTTILYANAGQSCLCYFNIMFPDGTQVSNFTGLFVQPMPGDAWSPAVQNASACPPPPPLAYTDAP